MVANQLIFHHDNNTTAEFDSGFDQREIEGKNTIQSVFCDILGGAKYSGRELPKKPYGTIAVKRKAIHRFLPCFDTVPKKTKSNFAEHLFS